VIVIDQKLVFFLLGHLCPPRRLLFFVNPLHALNWLRGTGAVLTIVLSGNRCNGRAVPSYWNEDPQITTSNKKTYEAASPLRVPVNSAQW